MGKLNSITEQLRGKDCKVHLEMHTLHVPCMCTCTCTCAHAGHMQGMHLGGTLQSLPRSCSVIELSLPILDLQYSSSVSGPTSSAEAARLWSFSASRSSTL